MYENISSLKLPTAKPWLSIGGILHAANITLYAAAIVGVSIFIFKFICTKQPNIVYKQKNKNLECNRYIIQNHKRKQKQEKLMCRQFTNIPNTFQINQQQQACEIDKYKNGHSQAFTRRDHKPSIFRTFCRL